MSMFTKVTTAAILLFASCAVLAQARDGALLANADADHDGKVTKQEFTDARAEQTAKLFDQFDTNHDDVLDAQEMEAARSAAKQRLRERRRQ
jgi:Ca2+-binding EF-hand superfamily protein